ncbi:MAG: hypothetical protein LUD76_10290 [Alistipes sp.]|nr:hypothetical protein [Alistipes sp.]
MKGRDFIYCIIIVFLLVTMFSRWNTPRESVRVTHSVDTVIFRDTIREPVPEPVAVHHYHTDTVTVVVYLPAESGQPVDSMQVPVPIPIEEKEYRTPDYYALVRGYRPELVRLDLFPESRIIYDAQTRTVTKRPRFGVGVQVGYGYGGQKLQPYVGVGLQYNLFTF